MLPKKTALYIAGVVFALVALLHLWRLATGADIVINESDVPTWISVVGLLVSGFLSYLMFSSACCCGSHTCSTSKDENNKNNLPRA